MKLEYWFIEMDANSYVQMQLYRENGEFFHRSGIPYKKSPTALFQIITKTPWSSEKLKQVYEEEYKYEC